MVLYVIHTSPKRIWFVNGYMLPCLKRYGIENIIVWNDENKSGQLRAWIDCARWILKQYPDCEGCWHLEDDVIPCKDFKKISEKLSGKSRIIQGFVTECPFSDFKGKTGLLPVQDLPYGMQCIYIPNFYLEGVVCFAEKFVYTGMYHKRQYDCGSLFSDNVFRGFLRKYCKDIIVNVLDNCMVEHVDYLIGGRSVKQKNVDRKAYKFDNYEEVKRLKKWLKEQDENRGSKK